MSKTPRSRRSNSRDQDLARLALEQAVKDNGESWNAGYVYVAGIAPLDRRNETWVDVKKKYAGIKEVAMFGTLDNPIANSRRQPGAFGAVGPSRHQGDVRAL